MNVYTTDKIRNVVLLGHAGSGKTSLVEAMAYLAGMTNRMGTIADGNTISDYDKEEIKRNISIHTSLVPIPWGDVKVNILDTPGSFDFVGEVEEAASVADAAIIVVSGKAGVQTGTKRAWEICEKYKLPRIFFVTEMDIDNASYRQVVADLQELYGKKIAPFHLPIRENEKLVGYVNVIKNEGRRYSGIGQKIPCDIPEYSKPNLQKYREKLLEAVAETSEAFMERYFEGDEFSVEEIRSAMRTEVMNGDIVPVAMGSNTQAQGVANLLSDIVRFFPSPDWRECAGFNRKTNEIYEANYDFARAKSAYVFKTMVDPFIGKYSFVKVCSGVLKGDDVLYNTASEADEKLGKIYTMVGNKPVEVSELFAGDIGAIAKLNNTKTGDTLATRNTPIMYGKTEYSKPYTYMKYVVKAKGDEDKVRRLEQEIALDMGFLSCVPVSGQTYSRKTDAYILSALSGFAQSASKFANDLRLLQAFGEMEEPYEEEQIAASSIPYMHTPIRAERICALSRYVMVEAMSPSFTASSQWLERTLDDSANRRLTIPETFLAVDAILNVYINITQGLIVNEDVVKSRVMQKLPLMAAERLVGDTENNDMFREYRHVSQNIQSGEALIERLAADENIPCDKETLLANMVPEMYIGRSVSQVEDFLLNVSLPMINKYSSNDVKAELNI